MRKFRVQVFPEMQKTGWWFGTFLFFHILGIVIIPTDELIFFRLVVLPPTRIYIYMVYLPEYIVIDGLP